MWNKIKPYVISILIPLAVGGLSAWLIRDGMAQYIEMEKPPISPPAILFPIVWTILFILMGIGSALIYVNRDKNKETAEGALRIYGIQLAVNFFWSIIFFNMQAYLFAFIWLVLLWVLILIMILEFRKISHAAAWLQLPYLLWVTFAGYLTFAVWLMNR
ncbi:MAG: tryptophan-rich sensory protein [Oscillospiraceae bacterium]|nr:tryptophan-rich sensory protein [Oscillospiraceae bacterium]